MHHKCGVTRKTADGGNLLLKRGYLRLWQPGEELYWQPLIASGVQLILPGRIGRQASRPKGLKRWGESLVACLPAINFGRYCHHPIWRYPRNLLKRGWCCGITAITIISTITFIIALLITVYSKNEITVEIKILFITLYIRKR